MAQFETTDCPACGSRDYAPELEVRDRFDVVPGRKYPIVRCGQCRLLFANPRPNAASIAAFYAAEGYDPFVSASDRASLMTLAYRFVRRFTVRRKVSRAIRGLHHPQGTALDVGCATGEILIELQRRGFQVRGVEPDPGAADYARQQLHVTVWTGAIDAVPKDAGPFDLITMWHVLEHVHDLPGTLQRVHELLGDQGRFVIAVPNPLSGDRRDYGTGWAGWDTPRHLYHFEPDVMLALLKRYGFQATRQGALAFDAFYHCLMSEPNKTAGLPRAAWRGSKSFLRGLGGGHGSSELYFATKRSA
jgi:2-polyprenyl-3-methyl-5-hydroxy-6-metoxy-1,4-benzoquinol methylase